MTGGGEAIETVTVIADALRMRASPSLDADVVMVLDKGTRLDVLEKNESWYKVRTPDGQIGWAVAYYEGDIYLD
ncbi:MAG: SH3 domain-containing protein [bacterium]|nr:SH3 domain-containing protein [bacterium]